MREFISPGSPVYADPPEHHAVGEVGVALECHGARARSEALRFSARSVRASLAELDDESHRASAVEIRYLNAWHIDVGGHPHRVRRRAVRLRAPASAQGCLEPIARVPPSQKTPAQQSEHR